MEKDGARRTFLSEVMDGRADESDLNEVHRNPAPAVKNIYFRINKFKRCRSYKKTEVHFGRPVYATTKDIIKNILMDDRRVKVYEIVETVGTSNELEHNILHEKMLMKKCA